MTNKTIFFFISGPSTSTNFQSQGACNISEIQQSSIISNNYNTTSNSTNYSTGTATSTSIPRPLQNVSSIIYSKHFFFIYKIFPLK